MTHAEKGNCIATAVWGWLQSEEKIGLVPWVTDPESDRFDPIRTAEEKGRKKCLLDLREYIEQTSEGLE